jgi:alpha-beta hydrolase superfamily lysophospholipase
MFKRSDTRVRFANEDMDFTLQWMLGYGSCGGASFGEVFSAARHIRDGDPDSWIAAFLSLGRRLEEAADALKAEQRHGPAAQTALRAFTGFRAAAQFMNPRRDARFTATVASFKRCFERAMPSFGHPCEAMRIPFAHTFLPAHFHRVDDSGQPRPTLIMIGGGDTYVEDLYFWAGAPGPKRGCHVLAVDLPGQGDTPARGLFFQPDVETAMRAVVDAVLRRPEVDSTRLAAYGISGGGYIVTRALAFEGRIRAAIADTPIHDLHRMITTAIPPILLTPAGTGLRRWVLGATRRLNRAGYNNLEKFAWQAGAPSLWDAMQRHRNKTQADIHRIACPMLCLAGAGDPPECLRQTQEVFDGLLHPRKALRIFTAEEGAEAHCHVNNFPLLHQVIFDWLDDVWACAEASV